MSLPNMNDFNKDAAFINMEVASGIYQFKVEYSKTTNIPDDNLITSPIFIVNGLRFKILYFPPGSQGDIGLSLEMCTKSENMTVSLAVALLDKYGRPCFKAYKTINIVTFCDPYYRDYCGITHFIEKSELEAHFVRDGCFTVVFSVTILNNSYKEVPKRFVNGIMPFSIDEQLFQFLDRKETSDVRFEVEGEIFTAHRSILAARSPVFNAEIFGPMVESKADIITIKDIRPEVFKAMLHFMYTDSLPDMSNDSVPLVTMTQHLLVAADRYALVGLKMLCEDSLVRGISVDTVISTLSLAEELGLGDLKNKCLCFVCEPKHLVLLSVKHDYVQLMVRYPSLLEEISNGFTKFVTHNPLSTVLI